MSMKHPPSQMLLIMACGPCPWVGGSILGEGSRPLRRQEGVGAAGPGQRRAFLSGQAQLESMEKRGANSWAPAMCHP